MYFSLKAVGQSGRQPAQGMSWAELLFGKETLAASGKSGDLDTSGSEPGGAQQNEVRTECVWDSGGGEGRQRRQLRQVALAVTRGRLDLWDLSYSERARKN